MRSASARSFFFFNDTATTEIYTLSLHDALPISEVPGAQPLDEVAELGIAPHPAREFAIAGERLLGIPVGAEPANVAVDPVDRKSTRLNSSHANISYAVFCLKKKNEHHAAAARES